MPRRYAIGRRQEQIDRTAQSILTAARELVSASPAASVSIGAIAGRAGVSRLTVYQRFGSRPALLEALRPAPRATLDLDGDARTALQRHLVEACTAWAANPTLYRHLPEATVTDSASDRRLAERLLAADALRPGCSLREAEDVIGTLASFAVFDRLHRDGRRSPAAAADILMRLAGGILA